MKSIYVETSIFSYLTARPSRDLLAAAHQQVTQYWWDNYREQFNLFVSPLVYQECERGDPDAARRRIKVLEGMQELEIIEEAYTLAAELLSKSALPVSAEDDATHIALAAVHGVDYLLTWNCRHIDNAETKPIVRSVCAVLGYTCPEICTPEELMGGANES